ncbi:MAG: hypothetical protein Q9166_007708 [cf. Caloplaca sp. 2 TL-2023]
MAPWLWKRKFIRDEGLDEDYAADSGLLEELHKSHDFFSEWLQQGQNSELLTLDTLLLSFWSRPWLHWFSPDDTAMLGSFSDVDKTIFQNTSWLTSKPTSALFQNVSSPEVLEGFVSNGVSNLFQTRRDADFIDTNNMSPLAQPKNIARWVAHLLLTTTVNIRSSHLDHQKLIAPIDHFYDNELLQLFGNDIMPDITDIDFSFSYENYDAAVHALGLCLIQEVGKETSTPGKIQLPEGTLGGGKETNAYHKRDFMVAQVGEGRPGETNPFHILTPSYEDAQGVLTMQNITRLGENEVLGLLSQEAFRAVMMVDFWNPIYSWRRGVLMQYIPTTVNFDGHKAYDFESSFIANIRKSPYASQEHPDNPENQFLQSLEADVTSQRSRIWAYLDKTTKRLKTSDGLTEHLTLAESRKRLYRPLPLDEFGYTLPYALEYNKKRPQEMTEQGDIQDVPQRGLDFLMKWLGTLSGYDPQVLPHPELDNGIAAQPGNLAKSCGYTNMQSQLQRNGGCPMRSSKRKAPSKSPTDGPM